MRTLDRHGPRCSYQTKQGAPNGAPCFFQYAMARIALVIPGRNRRRNLSTRSNTALSIFWLCAAPLSLAAQRSNIPTASSPHPAPQISGRLIGTDGSQQLILEYKASAGIGTFIGNVQSPCTIPAQSDGAAGAPLQLAQIQKGSHLTLFYVRHKLKTKAGKKTENVILAIRFDEPASAAGIAKGKIISCFKAPQAPSAPK